MKVIGCDFHPSFQQIAMLDESTGELTGRRLSHPAEAEARRALSIFLLTAASAIIERMTVARASRP